MKAKKRHAYGERAGHAKLTDEEVVKIRLDSRKLSNIALDYGVTYSNVRIIKSGRTWTHLNG